MPDMTVNGARISYDVHGNGKETIVFAHGLLWDSRMYEAQVAALSRDYRCVTFDFRGQGNSEVTESGYDMDTLTKDAAALIRNLQLQPCHFAGLSMGGFVAMRLAARHSDLLKSVILLETSAEPEPLTNVPRYRRLNFVARWFGIGLVAGPVMKIMFGEKFLGDPDRAQQRAEMKKRLRSNHRIGITRATRGVIERRGVLDEISAIRLPTLIIVGDQDVATVPEKSRRIHEQISGSRLEIVPGAGHTSTVEEPEAVNSLIRAFVESG